MMLSWKEVRPAWKVRRGKRIDRAQRWEPRIREGRATGNGPARRGYNSDVQATRLKAGATIPSLEVAMGTREQELLAQLNLEPLWMPFTANRQFKAAPRLLVSAKDMHYTAHDGRQILDGIAGLWAVNAGHCRQPIVDAIKKQAETLDYATGFQMHSPVPFLAAERLVRITPKGMDHVFFVNSGSEAVDTALKIALAYHRARGEGTRRVLLGRERGYHGVGFGGISVGGMV